MGAKAVEMALSGDASTTRALPSAIVPTRRDRAADFALPKIETAGDARKAQAAVSAEAKTSIEFEKLGDFLTSSEIEELARIWGELGVDHPTAHEIVLRSTTRSERYPVLWEGLHRRRIGHPKIPQPWSVDA